MLNIESNDEIAGAELRSSVLSALDRAGKPLSAIKLRSSLPKPFQRPVQELMSLLDALAKDAHVVALSDGKSRAYARRDPRSVAEELVLTELGHGARTKKQLQTVVAPAGFRQLTSLLEELAARQQLHAVYKRSTSGALSRTIDKYALGPPPPPPRALAPAAVVELLQAGSLTPAELKRRALKAVLGLSAPDLQSTLEELIQSGRVHAHRRTKTGKTGAKVNAYALEPEAPPDAALFIGKARAPLLAAIKAASAEGVSPAAVLTALIDDLQLDQGALIRALDPRAAGQQQKPHSAADPASAQRTILDTLKQLVARERSGALIPVRTLRRAVDLNPPLFDQAVLSLAERDAVILHHHDLPDELPEHERSELVRDAYGTHYVGIALGKASS